MSRARHYAPAELMLESPVNGFDQAIEWILAGMLCFMPAAFGVAEPWSELVVVIAAAALALLLVAKNFRHSETPLAFSWAYLPVMLFILLAVLQLVPLPQHVAAAISPNSLATRQRLLKDLPHGQSMTQVFALSFYPPGTRHDLMVVLVATAVFAAVLDAFREPARIRRLLTIVAATGAAFGLLAILQDISGATHIFWNYPTPIGRATAGPFIYYGNYAQYMNVCGGAMLGLFLLNRSDERRIHGTSKVDVSPGEAFRSLASIEFWSVWWPAIGLVIGVITIFLSTSRGGMVATLAAGAVAAGFLALRRRLGVRGWLMTLAGLALFITLLYTGFDAVSDRIATLYTYKDPSNGRMQTIKDIGHAWRQFPLLGLGLGTHEQVYPMFDTSSDPNLSEHADCDWAQLVEETGAAGLVLVLAFLAVVLFNYISSVKTSRPRICIVSVGLGYSLISAMVSSFTDFGQHVPAIACVTAIVCALLINIGKLARTARRARSEAEAAAPKRSGLLATGIRWALPLGLTVALTWALFLANTTWAADRHWQNAQLLASRLATSDWDGTDDEYIDLITEASAASDQAPENVEYRYYLNSYRWHSISRDVDPESGDVILEPDALDHTQHIVDELLAARAVCPTYGPLCALAGQLELFALNQQALGIRHLREGYALAPANPLTVFAAAVADTSDGKWEDSVVKFRKAMGLKPEMFNDAVDVYLQQLKRPDLAVALARDNAERLVYVATEIFKDGDAEHHELGKGALSSATELLRKLDGTGEIPAPTLYTIAMAYWNEGDFPTATQYLKEALKKNFGEVGWRLQLARLLGLQNRDTEAIEEAQRALHFEPDSQDAKDLILQLSAKPGVALQ